MVALRIPHRTGLAHRGVCVFARAVHAHSTLVTFVSVLPGSTRLARRRTIEQGLIPRRTAFALYGLLRICIIHDVALGAALVAGACLKCARKTRDARDLFRVLLHKACWAHLARLLARCAAETTRAAVFALA